MLFYVETRETLSIPTTANATHQPKLCKLFCIAQKEEQPNEKASQIYNFNAQNIY